MNYNYKDHMIKEWEDAYHSLTQQYNSLSYLYDCEQTVSSQLQGKISNLTINLEDKDSEIKHLKSIIHSLCDHMDMVCKDLHDKTRPVQNHNISSMNIATHEARNFINGN